MNTLTTFFGKNATKLLTIGAVAGVIFTTYSGIKTTPKVIRMLEDEGGVNWKTDLSKREIISIVWKAYLPTVISAGLTTAAIVSSEKISTKKSLALYAAYNLVENAFENYKEKVIETVGEKKHRKIAEESTEKKVVPKSSDSSVIITGNGDYLCYDVLSGRYFRSDIEKIRKTINQFNERLLQEMFLSLNDFYFDLGLKAVDLGNDVGWSVEQGGLLDITFSTKLDEKDEPCLVLDYLVKPRWNK